MKTRAAVLYEYNTPLVVEEVEVDGPQQGEVMVKLAASGVCRTNQHLIEGLWRDVKCPVIVGDEGAGTVVEVGAGVTTVKPGDHVVVGPIPPCRNCFYCHRGVFQLCENDSSASRFRKGDTAIDKFGGMSSFVEYTVGTELAAVPIPDDVPLDVAANVGCAVPTGWGAVVNTAKVEPGSSVAIIGLGGIGLSAVMGAVTVGAAKIIGADIKESKLEMARGFGVTHTINSADEDVVAKVRELTDGRGVDYAFDTIGLPGVTANAFAAVRPGGTAVAVGTNSDWAEVSLPYSLLLMERDLLGCFVGSMNTAVDVPRIIDLYRQGKLDLDRLASMRFPIEQVNEAIEAMLAGEVARAVVEF